MTPKTAANLEILLELVENAFPGQEVRVTSTVTGQHAEPKHAQGKAVDFVVEGISRAQSKILEKLCWTAGFEPFNEYVKGSTFKTGDHMHIQLLD